MLIFKSIESLSVMSHYTKICKIMGLDEIFVMKNAHLPKISTLLQFRGVRCWHIYALMTPWKPFKIMLCLNGFKQSINYLDKLVKSHQSIKVPVCHPPNRKKVLIFSKQAFFIMLFSKISSNPVISQL